MVQLNSEAGKKQINNKSLEDSIVEVYNGSPPSVRIDANNSASIIDKTIVSTVYHVVDEYEQDAQIVKLWWLEEFALNVLDVIVFVNMFNIICFLSLLERLA